MTHFDFEVTGARVDRQAAMPAIRLTVRVRARGETVEALALRVRVQIEPARRTYDASEESLLGELFGERSQWARSVRPVQWVETSAMVGPIVDEASFDVTLFATYDMEIASAKYLAALGGGVIPLRLLFTGTAFHTGPGGFSAEMVPWNLECSFAMPLATWREAMDGAFPNQAWLRLDRATFDALRRYRALHALCSWESTFEHLLAAPAGETP